ncbi:GntR family transcriptional regulator [Nitratireductor thuwali]|uniref:HTH-type transcriptional repressor RspR n=1 Tax=Nitratireductor thuwali TaxID=2267699 RepID=A0ABY5MPY6_9HYPH|nr:HTH-type transcriptional repressor RspR [Nitratireductor thuwali]
MALENFDPDAAGDGARRLSEKPGARSNRRSAIIFEQLQRDIMLGDLAPNETILELELAQRFACSQSTIREALLQLQEEGLVHRMPHRGTHVADCRGDDARELILVRHDIECRGVTRVMERYDLRLKRKLTAEIEAMQAAAGDGDEYLLSLHDRSFHLQLYEAADLPSIRPILRRCLIHNHRYKILNSEPNRALRETADRHLAIIEALDSGDTTRAVEALSHHITTIVDLGPHIVAKPGVPG